MKGLRRMAGSGVLLAAFVSAAAAGCTGGSGLDDREYLRERPGDVVLARRMMPVEWRQTMRIGGRDDDTTLVSPFRLNVTREGVYLLDYYPRMVKHYGHDGQLVWKFGRQGGGPNEFGDPRDLKVDASGRAWILDPGNARITLLAPDGTVGRRIPIGSLGASPREIVPLGPASSLLIADVPGEDPLVEIDTAGRIVGRRPFPWKGFSKLSYLATQVTTGRNPATGDWAMAFRMGDGFFAYTRAAQARRGWFVEHVPFPEVVVSKRGNTTTWSHRERPVDGAIALTLSPTHLYVLFGGTSRDRGKIVDSYSLDDGTYAGTYLLPQTASEIGWYDGGLYTLANRPYPELALWRPTGARLP